jgi:hypothetical protein
MIKLGSWYIGPIEDIFDQSVPDFPPNTPPNLKSKVSLACIHALNYLSNTGKKYGGEFYLIEDEARNKVARFIAKLYRRNEGRSLLKDIPKMTQGQLLVRFAKLRKKYSKELKLHKGIGNYSEDGFIAPDTNGVIFVYIAQVLPKPVLKIDHTRELVTDRLKAMRLRLDPVLLCTYTGSKKDEGEMRDSFESFVAGSNDAGIYYKPDIELLRCLKNEFEPVKKFDELIETHFGVNLTGERQ